MPEQDSPNNEEVEVVADDPAVEDGQVIDTIALNEPEEAVIEDSEGIIDELKGILAELHIGGKQFFLILAFVLALLTVIIASFVFLFRFLGDDVDTIGRPEVKPIERIVEEKPVDNEPGFIAKFFDRFEATEEVVELEETSVEPTTNLGRDEADPVSTPIVDIEAEDRALATLGTNIVFVITELGADQKLSDRLSYYTRTYRRVRNTFNTDLFSLLDNAVDRKIAYDAYMLDFKAQQAEAFIAFEDLRQEVALLTENLERVQSTKVLAEEQYLTAADSLQSEALNSLLDRFQELAGQEILVRSELKAREQILRRYESGIPLIAQKIEAIEANQDAFVKGVRIVDFPNVELDLVIDSQ